MPENTPCEHGYAERSWCGKCMRADAPERTPLSDPMEPYYGRDPHVLCRELASRVATLLELVDEQDERIAALEQETIPFLKQQLVDVSEQKLALLEEKIALEQERDELEAYLMETLDQLDDCKLGYIDCLKSRSFELRRLEQELGETMVRANRYQARTLDLRAAIREVLPKLTPPSGFDAVPSVADAAQILRRALTDTEEE